MRKLGRREVLLAAVLLYVIALATYSTVVLRDYLTLLPALVATASVLVRRSRWLSVPLSLAAGVYYTSLVLEVPAAFIPIALSVPYARAERGRSPTQYSQVLGPTSTRLLKYVVFASPLSVLDVRVLAPLAMLATASLLYSLIYFIRLGGVRAELMEVPEEVTLGRPASALVAVSAPSRVYVVAECGEARVAYVLVGTQVVKLNLPTDHVGPRTVLIRVYVVDEWGFSGRLIKSAVIKYSVTPLTSRIIGVLRRKVFTRAEFRKLISEVEVTLVDVGIPLVVTRGGGAEVSEIIKEYLRKVRLYASAGYLIERFAEVLKTVDMEERPEGVSSLRRGRLGDYLGVRYYVPGDSLRDIHWKKSLSKLFLVVKEFSASIPQDMTLTKSSALEPVVIVDLFAPNHVELDKLIFTLLAIYLSMLRKSPVLKSCLVMVAGGAILVVRGKVVDLLYRLYRALREYPELVADYVSVSDYSGAEVAEAVLEAPARPKLHSVLITANVAYSKALLRSLAEGGVMPPKVFTLIHSSAMSFRYGVVKRELTQAGFTYVPVGAVAEVVATRIRGGVGLEVGGRTA